MSSASWLLVEVMMSVTSLGNARKMMMTMMTILLHTSNVMMSNVSLQMVQAKINVFLILIV
jgi:hypothetical protein